MEQQILEVLCKAESSEWLSGFEIAEMLSKNTGEIFINSISLVERGCLLSNRKKTDNSGLSVSEQFKITSKGKIYLRFLKTKDLFFSPFSPTGLDT